jgi:hypothetical protein
MEHKYLFILSPPYSGSTLIVQLVGTSKNASIFSSKQSEGQKLEELKPIMLIDKWDETKKLPWKKIKKVFLENWDLKKPILVEKSPPNIIRTKDIIQEFQPVFFIITIKNPYSWAYSVKRRKDQIKFSKVAQNWVRMAKHQMNNISNLKNSLFFKYEDLTDDPEKVSQDIGNFLNELNDINYDKKFKVHSLIGRKPKKISNLNNIAISKMSLDNIHEINKVLNQEKEILKYFSYDILSDDEYHSIVKNSENRDSLKIL